MSIAKRPSELRGTVITALFLTLSTPSLAYTFTTLYHFTDKADGGEPIGGVVQDAAGTLYGETSIGGGVPCSAKPANQGCGTVYSLSSAGAFKVLATFTGPNGGHGNITPVLVGHTLYGATSGGGPANDGVVFSVNTDGTDFTVLHAFSGADGAEPVALVVGAAGLLYGVTRTGGSNDEGVLFSIAPSGFTVLHNFALPVSGHPNTLISTGNGALVGATFYGGSTSANCPYGCGTTFSYVPSTGRYTSLYTFASSGAQGGSPYVGSIGTGPTVYGITDSIIYGLSKLSGFVPLVTLNPYTTGSGAQSGPLYGPNGVLYGVLGGSITATDGLIYSLQNGVITDLYLFGGTLNGASGKDAIAQPILTSTGSLIGTTHESGLCNPCGTVWEYTP